MRVWARKLTNPPNSLYDYNDAKRGLEPQPANASPFRQNATRESCLTRSPRAACGSPDSQPGARCGIRARV